MNTYIGIDLGTSGVKVLLVQADGKILASVTETYPVIYPQTGWSEQDPSDWLQAVDRAMFRLLEGGDRSTVKGISFGGQMHGLVILDENDKVIRPCILWNDGRTEKQTAYLNEVVGKRTLSKETANIAFAGFTAPKLLWLKENEKENFERICKMMLPKDYLAYCMTGNHSTDYSDASGTLLLDVKNRRWSKEMCRIVGIREEILPRLYESYEVVGTLKKEFAERWGLQSSVKVVAGAGDNAAAAIGTGTVNDGDCNISLGTSGTIFIAGDKFSVDEQNALHSFDHANGKYHLMGCILSAASANAWWMGVLKSKDFALEQSGGEKLLGENSCYFLPYLMGERSPHNDVNAKGCFIGITPETTRAQMTLAVMEGVAFALRDCFEIAKQNGICVTSTKICGGGAKSKLWRKIIANVLGVSVSVPTVEEGPSYGGAILAMVACGEYATVEKATSAICRAQETVRPERDLVEKYEKRYKVFKQLYPALKNVFPLL